MTDQLEADFEGAVLSATRALSPFVQDGKLKTDMSEPSEFRLRFELRIRQGNDDQGVFFDFPEGADRVLHQLSATDRGAFDIYSDIIASRLFRDERLSEGMRVFAGLMVVDRFEPPKPSKKKSALFVVHSYIYWIATYLAMKFNISLTSNDAGPNLSACHAISAALERLGHAKSPRAIKEILVGSTSADVRASALDVSIFAREWREDDPEQAAEWDRMHPNLLG